MKVEDRLIKTIEDHKSKIESIRLEEEKLLFKPRLLPVYKAVVQRFGLNTERSSNPSRIASKLASESSFLPVTDYIKDLHTERESKRATQSYRDYFEDDYVNEPVSSRNDSDAGLSIEDGLDLKPGVHMKREALAR